MAQAQAEAMAAEAEAGQPPQEPPTR
jgi:hypothetical protein